MFVVSVTTRPDNCVLHISSYLFISHHISSFLILFFDHISFIDNTPVPLPYIALKRLRVTLCGQGII